MTTFEKIQALLAEQLRIDASKITLESNIVSDLKADSLELAEMLINVETEYKIEIPNEVALNIKTVGDIVDFVDKK